MYFLPSQPERQYLMNPNGKVILNYGGGSGLSSFGMFLLIQWIGWNPLGQASLLGLWIPVVFICLATGYYRDHILDGTISYGQAFRVGFLTCSAGALLFALFLYIYGTIINPGLVDVYKQYLMEGIEQSKIFLGEDMFEKIYQSSLENLDKTTMYTIASSDFFNKTFGGFLVSLITAGFYRRSYPKIEKE